MGQAAEGFRPGYCPSCERYIAAARTCPYCDCGAFNPPALRLLRVGAATLATLGLLLLFLYSRAQAIPEAEIATLVPMMNYATVRLTGAVTSKPYLGRSAAGEIEYLAFTLSDPSGRSVRVQAYGAAARELDASLLTSAPDRVVHVTGQLQVSPEGAARLRVRRGRDVAPAALQPETP